MPSMHPPVGNNGGRKEVQFVPVLREVDPDNNDNLSRVVNIRYFLKQLINEDVSKVLIADIFNMLFLSVPQLKEAKDYPQENRDHYDAMKSMLDQLSSSEIRMQTVSDNEKSTVATVNIILNLIKNMKSAQQDSGEGTQQQIANSSLLDKWLEGSSDSMTRELMQQLMMQVMANSLEGFGNDTQEMINRISRESAQKADPNKDMKDLEREAGHGPGSLEFKNPDPLADYLAKNAGLKKLLKILDGLPNLSSESQKYTKFTRGEYDGYSLGNNILSLTPTALSYPKEIIYAMYAHNKLQQYQRHIDDRQKNKYVLFDKSGSMTNDRLTLAKAVTIAMYASSVEDKSDFHLRFFDDQVYGKISSLKDSRRDAKRALVNAIRNVVPDGGTNIERAIITACADLMKDKSRNQNQIILVSDGESIIRPELIRAYLRAARAELIIIHTHPNPHPRFVAELKASSDHFFALASTNAKDLLLELVKTVNKRR